MSQTVFPLPHGGTLTRFAASGDLLPRPAVIICPGGGYEFCSEREGAPVGRAFVKAGFEAFVLEYCCLEAPLERRPLHTLAAAVAFVRGRPRSYMWMRTKSRSAVFRRADI